MTELTPKSYLDYSNLWQLSVSKTLGITISHLTKVKISRWIRSSRPDPDYAIFLSQFDSSSQGGNDLIQLARVAH